MHKRLFCALILFLLLFTLLPAGALASANENLIAKEGKTSDSGAQASSLIPQTTKVASKRTIANGRYTITSALASWLALDIAGASSAKGAKLQLWKANRTGAQVFDIQYRSDGFYSIRPLCSGLLLSVSNNNVVASTPIIQWSSTAEQGQRFAIQKNKNGSYTFLSKKTGLALSVSGSTAKSGAKIQLWYPNATKAQMFKIKAAESDPITIKEGVVSIIPVAKKDKRVDIAGASRKSGADAQAFKANDTLAQKFLIKRVAAQTYTFQCLNSGYYLSAAKGDVRQKAAPRGGLAKSQKWRAEWTYGGFSLVNVATGKAMTLTPGGQDGHNIKVATRKNVKTQAFFLQRTAALSSGTYLISTVGGKVIDSKNGGVKAGTNTQIWKSNGTAAQKWQFKPAGGGYFSIQCVRSGRVLDIKNSSTAHGANVRLWNYKGSSGQLWKVIPSKDGWFYIQAKNGSYLSVAGGGKKNGQNVRASKTPHKFRFDLTTYAGGAQALKAINSAKGSKSITSFGGYAPSSAVKKSLQTSLSSIQTRGYGVGFMMVDLTTGQGIAYNADQSFYSASTIKGPYVASVVSAKPSSALTWRSTMEATIRQSSNDGYASLRNAFGPSPMQQWCSKVGVPSSVASYNYTNFSTRTLTKLWLQNYTFFTGGEKNSKLCQSWFTSSRNSVIHATLGKYHYMNTKPGWIGSSARAANDAGIVWGNGGPYLITILTNAPGNVGIMKPLVWSIEKAHNEMMA
jgi:hypothetical protein